MDQDPGARTRIDKWLWAARFFKTRSLATEAVEGGKVRINGLGVKPAKEVRPGDRVAFSNGPVSREVIVLGIADKRGPAPVAQLLYEETAESIAAREQLADARRLKVEPAAERHGRPTKRERRDYERWRS
ncbi:MULTISPECIES: RNA-binding S4 domain-containing protein [unclassified Niveibacterium]|uniref:RNA-binding S4 domain-containing protein n=1 Tax=unclassified Niveibacterium TaxID=2648924 RepID=UPI001551992C|nr:S4 domain-containing protein [Niveibacterium sp. COAC-50]